MKKARKSPASPASSNCGAGRTICCVSLCNCIVFLISAVLYFSSREYLRDAEEIGYEKERNQGSPNHDTVSIVPAALLGEDSSFLANMFQPQQQSAEIDKIASVSETSPVQPLPPTKSKKNHILSPIPENVECTDPQWCNVPMPEKSYYGFTPPTDEKRWKYAQALAASGRQVLLERIHKTFQNPLDFLDGDRAFRRIHHLIDVFVDKKRGLDDLKRGARMGMIGGADAPEDRRRLANELPSFMTDGKHYVPVNNYDFRKADRAAIVQLGYTVFEKTNNAFFGGNIQGYAGVERSDFLRQWNAIKDDIDMPIIVMCQGNENWGFLSTMFPNRTAGWGRCCDRPQDRLLHEFLDHPKTLMLIINQHHNMTHPKILTLPRGVPMTWEATGRLVLDSIRNSIQNVQKKKLLLAASSTWGKRPQMLRCISNKLKLEDFEGHADTPKTPGKAKIKTDRRKYYETLSAARIALAFPGLGYDCFRTWEILTLGGVIALERGVGLDRSLWRLPALLLEDFDTITEPLLRSAYVEAMYRADEFEFERLRMSYWYNVIMNVSISKSTAPLLDAFPMEAMDLGFTRPREPYACAHTGTCGEGTKRIPRHSC